MRIERLLGATPLRPQFTMFSAINKNIRDAYLSSPFAGKLYVSVLDNFSDKIKYFEFQKGKRLAGKSSQSIKGLGVLSLRVISYRAEKIISGFWPYLKSKK
jgi:hypothetical protein